MSRGKVVVGTYICPDFHLSEVWMITPVISPDETTVISALVGSSADFCERCDKPVTELDHVLREVEFENEDAEHLYRVRRQVS